MRRKIGLALMVCLWMCTLLLPGCQSKSPLVVNVVCPSQPEWCEAMKVEFEARYKIKVNYVRVSTNEAMARIREQKDNPQFDIIWGGPSESLMSAKHEGLLQAYDSPNYGNLLKEEYRDPEGYWAGIYMGTLGFGTNTDWLNTHPGVKPPESWDDLLRPEFKGQIMMAHPSTSGTAYTILATILQLKGEEAGWEYMKQLSDQVSQFTKAGAAPATFVGESQAAVAIVFSHATIAEIEAGSPLTLTFPKDGTGYEIGAMAILKGAKNLEAAKMLYDWSLTAEMQSLAPKYKVFQGPTVKDVVVTHPEIWDAKLIDYDFEWAAENQKAFIERFVKEIATADNLKQ